MQLLEKRGTIVELQPWSSIIPIFWEEMNHCSDIVSEDWIEFIKRLVEIQKDQGKNFLLTKKCARDMARECEVQELSDDKVP